MKRLFLCGAALALTACSCTTSSKSRLAAQNAYLRGQNEAMMQMQQKQQQQAVPSVSFVGDVQNRATPWHEELSLSKAIMAAVYLGRTDPRVIAVIRNSQRHEINVRDLLRGVDDPLLEAGDVVEVRR
jgi:hypothetical protein